VNDPGDTFSALESLYESWLSKSILVPTIPKGLLRSSPSDVSSCVNSDDAAPPFPFRFLFLRRVEERVDGSGRV